MDFFKEIKMRILKTIALGACLFATPVWAESLHYNVVEFSETATVTVPNDTMNVALNIRETGKNRPEINNKVTQKLNAVLARAKNQRAFKVETGGRYTQPEYDNQGKIKSWTDIATIQIQSQDFEKLAQFIADTQNDAVLDNVSFSVSPEKRTQAVEQASEQLMKSFRQRAEHISKNLGFNGQYKLVKLDFNQSLGVRSSRRESYAAPAAAMLKLQSANDAASSMEVEAGEQEITQTIQVKVQM